MNQTSVVDIGQTDDECTVIMSGRVFRCRLVRARLTESHNMIDVTMAGDQSTQYIQGLKRVDLRCDYVVLGDVTVDAAWTSTAQASIAAAVADIVGPTTRAPVIVP